MAWHDNLFMRELPKSGMTMILYCERQAVETAVFLLNVPGSLFRCLFSYRQLTGDPRHRSAKKFISNVFGYSSSKLHDLSRIV